MQEIRIFSTVNHRAYDVVKRYLPIIMLMAVFIGINAWWLRVDDRIPVHDPPWHFVSSLRIWEVLQDFSLANLRTFMLCAFHPPLVGFLVRPFYFVLGENLDGAVLAMNLIFIPILVISVFKIIHILTSRPCLGFLGTLVLLSYPGTILASRMYFLELPLAAMVSLALYFLIRSDNFAHFKYSLAFGCTAALGMLTKFSFLAFVAGPLIYLTFRLNSKEKRTNFLIAILCALFFSSLWYLLTIDNFLLNVRFLFPFLMKLEYLRHALLVIGAIIVLYTLKKVFPTIGRNRVIKFAFGSTFLYVVYTLGIFARLGEILYRLIPIFVNDLMGFVNSAALFFLCGAFFFKARHENKMNLLLWGIVPICVFAPDMGRYLVPILPVCAIMIITALNSLKWDSIKRMLSILLVSNSLLLFMICTWEIDFFPEKITILKYPEINLLERRPSFECYGPPQPVRDEKVWNVDRFFDALVKNGTKDNEVVWLLVQHKVYGTPTLGYYAWHMKQNFNIWSLVQSAYDYNVIEMIDKPEFRYFVDVQGFSYQAKNQPPWILWKEKLQVARSYIQGNIDKFQVILRMDIPEGYTVVVYKKKDVQ